MQKEAAFMEQIRENKGIILKLVGLYANDEEERKDLYQEILFQAWKGYSGFRGDSKFSTWLYRISLNTILTSQRKAKRVDYRESVEDVHITDEQDAAKNENTRLLRQAIRSLPETERALITLHLDGYSNPEIADIIGITVNNATVKLHRIKNQLINQLQPQLS
ncbi:MAG: sigma-70 family RNA polymerase sigma factor [Chitinophagaceae bacterium]|jgi:RNA polymerase sigma-70 factor (ECF subfamily)|nr:sigma-70 family RNA polymerase sigma factor [Chitinophagaceae bacterium]